MPRARAAIDGRCRSASRPTARRETPGPGRRSSSRLRFLGAELAHPIAQARGRVVGAAFLANQPLHLCLEIEDLLAGGTVVQVCLDVADFAFTQLTVDVGVEPAHGLFAVISHQRAPTASDGAFGLPEYSHNFFCNAWRPRCRRDMTVPIFMPRIDATSL